MILCPMGPLLRAPIVDKMQFWEKYKMADVGHIFHQSKSFKNQEGLVTMSFDWDAPIVCPQVTALIARAKNLIFRFLYFT